MTRDHQCPEVTALLMSQLRSSGDLTKAAAGRVSPTEDYHTREVSGSGSGKVDAAESGHGAPQCLRLRCPELPSTPVCVEFGPESRYCGARASCTVVYCTVQSTVLHSWLRLRVSQLTQIPDTDLRLRPQTPRLTRHRLATGPTPLCANLVHFM